MRVDILYSGSRGNSTLVRSGKTGILIDCGKSAKALCKAISGVGYDAGLVSAAFITHEHTDHTAALGVLSKKYPFPIHITETSALGLKEKEKNAYLVIHETHFKETVGDLFIESFSVPHDSRCNVGYIIKSKDGDSLGIATDIGCVTDELVEKLSECRRVIIESNHDEKMLDEGPYPKELKERIKSPFGHLSNGECALLACKIAKCGCEAFALAHISADNNTCDAAYCRTRENLDKAGFEKCALTVTYQDMAVRMPHDAVEAEKKDFSEAIF